MSASPEHNEAVGTQSRKRQRVDMSSRPSNEKEVDEDPQLNTLTSILNDLVKVDDGKEFDVMDLCHVPPTINGILQDMKKLHGNEKMISLLVKILVKFHLLHSDLKLTTTEQEKFYNAYRERAKLWVISCFGKLMKPNNTSIASIDALIADAFQYEGILDLDTVERDVLEIINQKILDENKDETSMAASLDICNGDDLSNDMMGLVSSQLESFRNEQGLDSTSLVDLVLNE
ncbi:predicted protein [Chaetoceros tenuissimus]|uniref:Uncharacterized protein n=1 Tax=Chaetoceros tenuissimus TaxID=426638 RepID=A0AAD3D609_9STRA|nr:predicted protein [Chaetoceros tenuissimus]